MTYKVMFGWKVEADSMEEAREKAKENLKKGYEREPVDDCKITRVRRPKAKRPCVIYDRHGMAVEVCWL